MTPPGESLTQLILTDSETDRVRWVSALQELHKALKKNSNLYKTVSHIRVIVLMLLECQVNCETPNFGIQKIYKGQISIMKSNNFVRAKLRFLFDGGNLSLINLFDTCLKLV